MSLIVFDLEWNIGYQPRLFDYHGAEQTLRGEIIQIGAVKVDETGRVLDTFSLNLKPRLLRKLPLPSGDSACSLPDQLSQHGPSAILGSQNRVLGVNRAARTNGDHADEPFPLPLAQASCIHLRSQRVPLMGRQADETELRIRRKT